MSKTDQILLTLLFVCSSLIALREFEYWDAVNQQLLPLTIYIQGEVQKPQMLTLPKGSRRIHAFEYCGGLTKRADRRQLQPARLLIDGETITVAKLQPPRPIWPVDSNRKPPDSSKPPIQIRSAPGKRRSPVKMKTVRSRININSGTEEQWQTIPGIGPVLAKRITHARAQKTGGTFTSLEDLTAIRGINKKTMVRLSPYLELEGI